MLAGRWCKAVQFGNSDEAASLLETQTETCPKVISFMTQAHWQHRLQCWRTTGLAQDERCKPALKSQLFSIHSKSISEGPRMIIPGRTLLWWLQEAAGEGRKPPGSGHSFWAQPQPDQVNVGPKHWSSKSSSAELWAWEAAGSSGEMKKRDHSSGLSAHVRLLLVTGEVQQTSLPPVPCAQRLHSP